MYEVGGVGDLTTIERQPKGAPTQERLLHMRVTRAQAEENRRRIIASAGELFRERGFDGIGIVDLMRSVGLTQGGFYKQFGSKEDLSKVAAERMLEENLSFWRTSTDADDPDSALADFVRAYLSPTHRDHPGKGCLLAALAAESARHTAPVRTVFAEAVEAYAAILLQLISGRKGAPPRAEALATLAQMVGALTLARAVSDSRLSDEILAAAIHAASGGGASETLPDSRRKA